MPLQTETEIRDTPEIGGAENQKQKSAIAIRQIIENFTKI